MGKEQASNQHIKGYAEWLEATYADPYGSWIAAKARKLQVDVKADVLRRLVESAPEPFEPPIKMRD